MTSKQNRTQKSVLCTYLCDRWCCCCCCWWWWWWWWFSSGIVSGCTPSFRSDLCSRPAAPPPLLSSLLLLRSDRSFKSAHFEGSGPPPSLPSSLPSSLPPSAAHIISSSGWVQRPEPCVALTLCKKRGHGAALVALQPICHWHKWEWVISVPFYVMLYSHVLFCFEDSLIIHQIVGVCLKQHKSNVDSFFLIPQKVSLKQMKNCLWEIRPWWYWIR